MNSTHPDTREAASIEAYLKSFPTEIQSRLRSVWKILRDTAPDATEAIKYRMPTLVLGENLIHIAGYENHIGLYPTPSAITAFKDRLAKYPNSKGAIQFPHDSPLPTGLIQAIVEFRVREVQTKRLSKKPSQPKAKVSANSPKPSAGPQAKRPTNRGGRRTTA